MPVAMTNLVSQLPIPQNILACGAGTKLAQTFLEAAGECVNTLGKGRTSSSRATLLSAYNAMVMHGDTCENCNRSLI
jgi:Flp pilus assembly CpaF family ATPase